MAAHLSLQLISEHFRYPRTKPLPINCGSPLARLPRPALLAANLLRYLPSLDFPFLGILQIPFHKHRIVQYVALASDIVPRMSTLTLFCCQELGSSALNGLFRPRMLGLSPFWTNLNRAMINCCGQDFE